MADFKLEFGADLSSLVKDVSKATKSIESSFSKAASGIAASLAVFGVGFSFKAIIDAGVEAENSLDSIRSAFIITGVEAENNSKKFADFASELSKSIGIADDEILQLSSRLQAIGGFTEAGLEVATQAALDLAAAFKIKDPTTAFDAIAKAATGNVSALGRLGLVVKEGNTNAETFNNTLLALAGTQGAAARQGQTFGSALKGISNGIGEMVEAVGVAIIRTPELASLTVFLKDQVFALAKSIENNASTIQNWISSGISVALNILRNLPGILSAAAFAVTAFTLATNAGAIVRFAQGVDFTVRAIFALRGSLIATTLASNIMWGSITLGASVVVGYLVQLRSETSSWGDTFTIFGAQIQQFFLALGSGILGFSTNAQNKFNELQATIDKLKGKKINIELKQQLGADASPAQKAITEYFAHADKASKEATSNIKSQFDGVVSAVKGAGLTQMQAVRKTYDDQLEIVNKARSAGIVTESQYREVIKGITAKYNEGSIAVEKKRVDDINAAVGAGSGSITGFINNFKKLKKAGASPEEQLGAGLTAAVSSVTAGAEGARQAVVGVLSAGAELAFGPLGKIAGPLLDAFSKGPDEVKKMVTEFLGALPKIVENIILSIPAFVIAILKAIPVLIRAILTSIPVIIDGLVAAIPEVITALTEMAPAIMDALIELAPGLIIKLSLLMPMVAITLVTSLISQIPFIVQSFISSFVSSIPMIVSGFIKALIDGVKQMIDQIKDSLGGGVVGKATGFVKSIGKKLGFAEGGIVPGGAPFTDRIPAMLTPGELVIPRDQVNSGGGGTTTVINKIYLSEKQLAESILNLNRQGYRIA